MPLSSPSEQNRLDRFEQDRRIERQALVLDVVKIVLQLLLGVLDRRAIRIFDLRPTRQPGRDQMALFVKRNFLGQLGNEMRTFGPRANEIHVAPQDAPKLWNLVHANLADDASHSRHTLVFSLGPDWPVLFSVNAHGTKLHQ